jgi:hypothetical protein
MNTLTPFRAAFAGLVLLALGTLGCENGGTTTKKQETPPAGQEEDAGPPAKKSAFPKEGSNVYLETRGKQRRVLINAVVCGRKLDQLEQLLCRKQTKEHESILAAEVDARHIHAALLAAGAEAGSPVQYRPQYKPATGTRIRVLLRYELKGKTVTVPAQQWVRNVMTKKNLEYDWVFAGSRFFPHPEPGHPPQYAANSGDVICVSNFDTAMLDLPVLAPSDNDNLMFEAHAERIPEVNTPVTVILEPVLDSKKK